MAKDFYKTLGIEKSASQDEIKKAYRKLALKYHPDHNKDDETAEARFKDVSAAYEVLKDEKKRAAYDQYGAAAFDGSMGGGPGGMGGMGGAGFGGGFSDIFEDMFGDIMGGGRRGGAGTMRGSDIQYALDITLEDSYNGKEETIRMPLNDVCDACDGSGAESGTGVETCNDCGGAGRVRMQQGFFTIERTCPSCNGQGQAIKSPCKKCSGAGRVQKEKKLKIKIPAGVDSGRRIRLTGEGEAGVRGGPAGDLYVLMQVQPHKIFKRDSYHLHCRVPIPMTTASLGGEIEVPTIAGKSTTIKIPAGTQSGQQFRLKGKGMPILRSDGYGDMYIEAAVETPVNLASKQKDLLQQLDKTMGGKAANKHSPQSSGFMGKVREFWDDLTE